VTSRAEQRAETRERIVEAAISAFSDRGFRGASTREIASRAGTNQGLITYHFRSKEELWRAAADRIFGRVRGRLAPHLESSAHLPPRERVREAIREFVRLAAAQPELFHFLVEEGKVDGDRMTWLVDRYVKPAYAEFRRWGDAFGPDFDDAMLAHAYYAMVGASSLMFAMAPECRRLTGLDPESLDAVETHADYVARLLVP